MAKHVLLMMVVVILAACTGSTQVDPGDTPAASPADIRPSTATPTPIPTDTPTPFPTPTPTTTPTQTASHTPTITPSPTATLLAGGSGQLIGNCTERTQASAIYLYDLATGELHPAQPEYLRSPDNPSLWITDQLNSLSPSGDLVVWQRCAYRNVEIEDPFSRPVMGDYANLQCGQYLSDMHFTGAHSLGDGIPGRWLANDLAVYTQYSEGELQVLLGDPTKRRKTKITSLGERESLWDLHFSPDAHYLLKLHKESEDIPGRDSRNYYAPYLLLFNLETNKSHRIFPPEIPNLSEHSEIRFRSIYNLGWHPGSSAVMFSAILQEKRGGYYDTHRMLLRLDLESLELEQLEVSEEISRINWSSTGEFGIALRNEGGFAGARRLYAISNEGVVGERVYNAGLRPLAMLSLSPDDRLLLVSETLRRDPTIKDIRLIDLELGESRTLATYERYWFSEEIIWSPDGQWFLVALSGIDYRFTEPDSDWLLCDREACSPLVLQGVDGCEDFQWLGPGATESGEPPTPFPTMIPATATVVPAPTWVARPEPPFYDTFDTNQFDRSLWRLETDQASLFEHEISGGVMNLRTLEGLPGSGLDVKLIKPSRRSIDAVQVFQARLRFNNISAGFGLVKLALWADPPIRDGWYTECGLLARAGQAQPGFSCSISASNRQEYRTRWRPVEFGRWYTVRIEVDPPSGALQYYLNGQLIDTYTPFHAEQLTGATFYPSVGIWGNQGARFEANIDEVRITDRLD